MPTGTVGPSPLLLAGESDAALAADADPGTPIPLVTVSEEPLSAARGARNQELFFLMPADPLAPGIYTLNGAANDEGSTSFEVADAVVAEPSLLGDDPSMELYVGEWNDGGGWNLFGTSASSCDGVDLTALTITLPGGAPIDADTGSSGAYLVTFTWPDGSMETAHRLVRAEWGSTEEVDLMFPGSIGEAAHFSELGRFCVGVRGVAGDGSLGDSADLGCLDPGDPNDPRVTYADRGGSCVGGGTPPGWGLGAVALYALARWLRRAGAR